MNKKRRLLKNALGANAFWQLNKQLYHQLGWRPAILLTHLIDLLDNYEGMPDEFYQQYTRLKESLKFSRNDLDYSFKILKEKNLISVELKGIPAKNHYTLNEDAILNLMIEERTTSSVDDELGSQNLTDKYKEKERKKNNLSSAVAGKDPFSIQSQAAEHMVTSLANWKELTSIWVTNESSAILKSIFKKYFLPLGASEQQEILEMVKSFGSDVQYLRNSWIGTMFKEGLVNRETLTNDIKKRKSSFPSQKGKFKEPGYFGAE